MPSQRLLPDKVPVSSRTASGMDGRWLIVLMILVYFGAILIVSRELRIDFHLVWCVLGVPALPHHFEDLRQIAIGIERFHASAHAWNNASIASATAAFNYPKWWLLAGYLGLKVKTYHLFGDGLCLLFLACAFIVLGRINLVQGFVAGFVLVSPAVMTGIERANSDLVIFALMTLVLAQRRSVAFSALGITMAALLKIYPAAALVVLARPPWRKTVPWIVLGLGLFLFNVLASLDEYRSISAHATRVGWFSFGSTTLFQRLEWIEFQSTAYYVDIFIMGSLLLLVVVGQAIRFRPQVDVKPAWEKEIFAFQMGASIYVGTFALGSNLDYRAIMLIFCLPLLFVLMKETGPVRLWATTSLALIMAYTDWRFFLDDNFSFFFFPKQLTAWALVACLTGIFAGTFPISAPQPRREAGR